MEEEFTDDVIEWGADDSVEVGYCPICKRMLKDLTISGQGYCPEHKWVFADFDRDDEEEFCDECGAPLVADEGEGYDGLCGDCADQAEKEGRWS